MYLMEFTVPWIKATARKQNCVGTSWLRTSWLVHLLATGLAHLLWLFSPPPQRKLLLQVRKG